MNNVDKVSNPIKSWAADERPREKLLQHGIAVLSNAELVALLINNGHKSKSAIDLAKELLQLSNNNLNELGRLSLKEFQQVKGIGVAKAISVAAALELGRRRQAGDLIPRTKIQSSKEVADYLRVHFKDLNHEVFAVVYLNRANKIMNFEVVSQGGITGTVADTRIILKKALEAKATSIVICHNHPSGNLMPSKADEDLTKKIKQAAQLLDIQMLDHLIVSDEGYYSFADEGNL